MMVRRAMTSAAAGTLGLLLSMPSGAQTPASVPAQASAAAMAPAPALAQAQAQLQPQAQPEVQPQTPPVRRGPRPNMQMMSEALGVKCVYCHVATKTEDLDYRSEANPRKQVARLMVAMTADINAAVSAATLKASTDAAQVQCITCHRGRTDPRPLEEILTRMLSEGGVEAAIARYRELRAQFYGRDAYDFSEKTLLRVAQQIVERGPEAAIALMQVNLEFHPRSADTWVVIGVAHTRRLRNDEAMVAFQKAVDLNPNHALAQGFLYQTQNYRRTR